MGTCEVVERSWWGVRRGNGGYVIKGDGSPGKGERYLVEVLLFGLPLLIVGGGNKLS